MFAVSNLKPLVDEIVIARQMEESIFIDRLMISFHYSSCSFHLQQVLLVVSSNCFIVLLVLEARFEVSSRLGPFLAN